MNNNKGFTLVEILAVIIIIGIIATIGISSIAGSISSSRETTFINLAKNYAESARNMRGKDELYHDPKDGEVVVMPCSQLTGTVIENSTESGYGDILPSYCYVGVLNNKNNYYYYVNLVDDTYHFIKNAEYNSMKEEDIKVGIENLAEENVKELKAPISSYSLQYGGTNYNINAVRVKFSARGNGKEVTLYGYFSNDSSYSKMTAHIKGSISIYDGYISSGKFSTTNNNVIRVNGVDYTVYDSQIMCLILKK